MSKINSNITQGYRVVNSIRGHECVADEPIDEGGLDQGPKPTEIVLASLASCKLMTVKMYANRKGWKLDEVKVELEYLERGEVAKVSKKIEFIGDLDEDQRKRLLDISGRCPVVKMLSKSIEFVLIDA